MYLGFKYRNDLALCVTQVNRVVLIGLFYIDDKNLKKLHIFIKVSKIFQLFDILFKSVLFYFE